MCGLMLFVTVLVFLSGQSNAGIDVSNTAIYKEGDLRLLFCKSFSHLSLCNKSSLIRINLPFAHHRLPDGVVLDLCLEPSGSFCEPFTLSESYDYVGLEVMKLERKLIGNGAHRELKTSLTARLEKYKECHIVIIERLSSGVFADLFELEGLVAHAVYDDVAIYGDHNLELPALHSYESMVALHMKLESNLENFLQPQISLPLHARYPPLSFESHVVVDFKFPYLLMRCFQSHNVSASPSDTFDVPPQTMPWVLLTMKKNTMLDSTELRWLVPAGNPRHTGIVAAVTGFLSLAGVVVLWVVSIYSFQSHKLKAI